jgi:hypothetical protein
MVIYTCNPSFAGGGDGSLFEASPNKKTKKKLEKPYLKKKEERKKEGKKLYMVVHTCNPSYAQGRDKRIMIQGWPHFGGRPYLKNKLKQKGLGA